VDDEAVADAPSVTVVTCSDGVTAGTQRVVGGELLAQLVVEAEGRQRNSLQEWRQERLVAVTA